MTAVESLESNSQGGPRPAGTITFLFTDVQGSTQLWERHPAWMEQAHSRHEAILREAIAAHGGWAYKQIGDSFQAAFQTAPAALAAAVAAQLALAAEGWNEPGPIRVRMGLHTGTVEERADGYFGPLLNRVHRLMSAGHGGQILLTASTYELVRDHVPPGVELRDLGERRLKDLIRPEQVYQVVATGLPGTFPPLKTLDAHPNNLPAQPNAFIGREAQIATVAGLLRRADVRLLTLTGPGGTGKTRLALQVAADLLDEFADGVWFVDLAPLIDPNLVPATIAHVLDVTEQGTTPILDTLRSFLYDKRLLLVLDNFEQVTTAAPGVGHLLAGAPGLKILVTSRALLRLYGEHDFAVPPLQVPAWDPLPTLGQLTQYEAVRLFIERAEAARTDFAVTNQNAPAIAEICARLDGLPLAIELAAARVRLFAPEALLTRLGARLAMLTGGPRNLPARQQTLHATIEWSYNLLNPAEQQLFRRLAVFQGGRTLEAIDPVCNYDAAFATSTLDWIQELLDKSLLRTEPAGSGEPRFVMLETIHEYARARLIESGELDEVRRRHGLYFLHLAEQVAPQLHQAQQYKVLAQLEEEFDNLRAVLEWALGDPNDDQFARLEVGLRLAAALTQFWDMHAHLSEGRRWFAALLDHYDRKVVDQGSVPSGGLKQARAGALCGAGWLAWRHADFTRAQTLSEESLAITTELGDQRGVAEALYNLGCVALLQGQLASAYEFFQQSLVISPKLDDTFLMYVTLGNLAWVVEDRDGDAGAARRLREQSLALARVAGDKLTIARQLNNLGEAAQMAGDYGQARAMYEESLPIRQELGDKIGVAIVLNNLGLLAQAQTDFAGARPLHFRAFLLSEETGHQFFSGESLAYLAGALAREVMSIPPAGNAAISAPGTQTRGEIRRIAEGWRIGKLLGAAERLLEVTSQVFEPAKRQHYEQTLSTVQELLGAEGFAAARREGRSLSLPELRTFAGELVPPLPGSQTDELFAS